MGVYSTVFSLLVLYVSYIVYNRYINVYSSFISKPNKRYDYIIVGAGTAGCVLAARLSEDPKTTVLLVEAGEHMGYFTKIPLTATAAQQTPNDWSVRTKSQKYSSFGLWDQTQYIPRGKGVGGSGHINFLLHGFGLPEDYDRWSKLGFKMWTRGHLRPYFKKAFGTVRSEFDSEICQKSFSCRGWEAPMKLKMICDDNELLSVFQRGSLELSDNTTIFKKATATIKDGARFSIINAYLKPALKRQNLHVLTQTKGVSIRFEDKKATSLYILQNHRELDNIFVNKEIIVSAGAIKTPQLMILSGIGPKNLIEKLRIKLVSENNNVGKNLHDHMNMPIYVSIKSPISITLGKVFSFDTVWQYYWSSEGLLSFPPVAGIEYHNNSALILFSMGSSSERLLRDLSNYQPEVFRDTFPFYNDSNKEGFMFLATCVQPKSRGSVTVRDSSTTVPPVVDPNYLHHHFDVKCIIDAIRRAERLVATKPFQEIGAFIHWPRPERCRPFWRYTKEDQRGPVQKRKRRFTSQKKEKPKPMSQSPKALSPPDEYLECIIREVAVTGHHVAGTCSGGTVVDNQLRVKAVTGVRIMDASILPSPLSLFPNSVLIAMAERAADLIRYNYNST